MDKSRVGRPPKSQRPRDSDFSCSHFARERAIKKACSPGKNVFWSRHLGGVPAVAAEKLIVSILLNFVDASLKSEEAPQLEEVPRPLHPVCPNSFEKSLTRTTPGPLHGADGRVRRHPAVCHTPRWPSSKAPWRTRSLRPEEGGIRDASPQACTG